MALVNPAAMPPESIFLIKKWIFISFFGFLLDFGSLTELESKKWSNLDLNPNINEVYGKYRTMVVPLPFQRVKNPSCFTTFLMDFQVFCWKTLTSDF